jgi:DNA-3-methyladenine glycosylase II
MRIDTEADLAEALHALARLCPLMAGTLQQLGPPPLRRRPPGFEGLIQIVVFQQISVDAGRAIWARFAEAFGTPTPQTIRDAGDDALRAAGLSRPKVRTLQAMAEAALNGSLELNGLDRRPADEAHAHLVRVKGIGPWTADVYLLSCLGHPDAWPAGDIALQAAAGDLLGLPGRPSAKEMGPLAERWRPWRAVAARLLWAHYGARRAGKVMEPLVITT